MCLAYSGRCFLSKYLADRSANKGDCAHSCRWKYRVLEESERQGEYFPLIEGENFTSILSSKDICMIDHIKDLQNAGIDSLKIEGRMKSIYYTAVVTRAYRKMIDSISAANEFKGRRNNFIDNNLDQYVNEIYKVSHREFSTGFYYSKEEIEESTYKSYMTEYNFLGSISELIKNTSFHNKYCYLLDVKNQISVNKEIEYIGPDLLYMIDTNYSLYNENFDNVLKADHGKISYLVTDKKLEKGFIIREKHH